MPEISIYVNLKKIGSIDTKKYIHSNVSLLSVHEKTDLSLLSTGFINADEEIDDIINQKIQPNDKIEIFFGDVSPSKKIGDIEQSETSIFSDIDKTSTIFRIQSSDGIEVGSVKTFSFSQHVELSYERGSDYCVVLIVSMDFKGNEHNLKFKLKLDNSLRIVASQKL